MCHETFSKSIFKYPPFDQVAVNGELHCECQLHHVSRTCLIETLQKDFPPKMVFKEPRTDFLKKFFPFAVLTIYMLVYMLTAYAGLPF